MISVKTILPGVELRACRDSRFKQGCLSIQFVRPTRAEESAMNALIPNVLLRGTRQHPDLRSVTMVMDDLYGASISPVVRRVGDYQTMGLYCSFMDERFALPGDRVLEPLAHFVRELLLDSPLENGGFLADFVESEKKNLISTIESERNDKRVYAINQLLRRMCKADPFGLPRMGETEQVAAIDPVELYSHYRTILRESQVRIFYVGSEALDTIAELVKPIFAGMERDPLTLPCQTDFRSGTGVHETETMEVAQGKLCMGFTTPITLRTKEFAAMQLLNVVFGGGMTSKLFQNVREKQSLCYNIGSIFYGSKGIMLVYAGIDFDKEAVTRAEVLRQLELCRGNGITQQELVAAREAIVSSLRATHDTPSAIEGYYATGALSGLGMTPQQYMDAVNAVTLEDLTAAARKLSLNSTYFLKGAQSHD